MSVKLTRLFRLGHSNFDKLEDVIGEVDLYNGIRKDFPKSLTDESYYVPNSEVNKTIDKLRANGNVLGSYDFPTGSVDFDASIVAALRRPGLDVAEVSQKVRELDSEVKERVAKDKEDANYKAIKEAEAAAAAKLASETSLKETIVNTVNQVNNSSK